MITTPYPSSDIREHSGHLKPALRKFLNVLGILSCGSDANDNAKPRFL